MGLPNNLKTFTPIPAALARVTLKAFFPVERVTSDPAPSSSSVVVPLEVAATTAAKAVVDALLLDPKTTCREEDGTVNVCTVFPPEVIDTSSVLSNLLLSDG